jgi:hypothetical protein
MHYRKYMSRDHDPSSPLAQAAQLNSKHMSCDRYLLIYDVTADTGITASSIVSCWTVLTELLLGNALIKSVTLPHYPRYVTVRFNFENIRS